MRKLIFLFPILFLGLFSCQTPTEEAPDKILINGNFYTVNPENPLVEALAIRDGRIMQLGTTAEIEALKGDATEVVDLQGQFAMPGFIEGHGHFQGIGSSLMNLNFMNTRSWEEIVAMVGEAAKDAEPGEWIVGRGWHQEKWTSTPERNVLGYPYHDELSAVSPDNPVLLRHASGHGSFANAKAMELAGITAETPNPFGGEIVRDSRGQAIGVFEETAQRLIGRVYEEYRSQMTDEELKNEWLEANRLAQDECLKKGVTSFQDAGSSFEDVEWFGELAENGELDLRLWVMIRSNYETLRERLGPPIIGAGNDFFTCRGLKTSVDGALGSYGAWLLESYDDKPDFTGQNTFKVDEMENIAQLAIDKGYQYCLHAIGDKANRVVLDAFEQTFQNNPDKANDLRWRIEHAQHLHPDDIPRFGELGVIASMQGIHCISDAPFVVKRLGEQRAREGAYPWRALLDAGAVVTNGTDAPVEDVDPIPSYYATVTRKRTDNGFAFFPEQAMTREEAIYSYTMACAYSAFEENLKGSLETGKVADIVVLTNDLLTCPEEDILNTEVVMTMVGGDVKYRR